MINKKRPDLLNNRMKPGSGPQARTDVSRYEGDVVLEILKEKGVITEGQKTIFDYFKTKNNNDGTLNERDNTGNLQ
jgi:hypothetical protein